MTSSQDSEGRNSPGAEFDPAGLLRVSPEQRLTMRNIPFFVLPPHETTPRTAHIRPRVDTHNKSYAPPEPHKIGKPYNQKFDYSQVKSRVDTRRSSSPESCESSFGRLSHSRLRINAHHRSSSPSPGSVTNRKFKSRTRVDSGGSSSSKSERVHSSKSRSKIADYSHIESRINAGTRTTGPAVSSSAKSERLSLSADSAGLRSRIRSSAVAASGGQASFKVSSSPLPDYSHVKSRTDSGQRPRSKSASGSQQGASSMSQNKAKPSEGTTRSSQAVKFRESPSHRLPRADLPRSRVPLSDTFPSKARKSSPTRAVNRCQGAAGSPEKYPQISGIGRGSIYSDVTRELEPAFGGRVSPSRSAFPQDKDTQDKISTGVVDFKAKAKSRIDCSDPNPSAHRLKHSLNELTVPLGRDINPRFSSTSPLSGKAARIVKSSSFTIERPVSDDKTESKSSTLVRSPSFESLFDLSQGVPDLQSKIEKITRASTNQKESASTLSTAAEESPITTNTMEVGLETVHHHHKFGWTEDSTYAVDPDHRHDIDVIFSSKPVYSNKEQAEQGKRPHGATVDADFSHGLPHRIGESSSTGVHAATAFHEDSTAGTDTARLDEEDDIQVIDFEVTSSETETTVFLKHLLATSSLNKETNAEESTDSSTGNRGRRSSGSSSALWAMPAIEESDSEESESYYESEDIVTTPPLLPIVPYTLPIPTVNLQDEDGTILEVILKGREGVRTESADMDDSGARDSNDETGATVDSGSDSLLAANYSPQTVYDDFGGPSTKL